MAAGKTRAAQAVAERLGLGVIDTDELLEGELGEPIATFFEREGEAGVPPPRGAAGRLGSRRARRRRSAEPSSVVSLGGGAVERVAVRRALAQHLPVWCDVDEEIAWERASGSGRPLAADRDGVLPSASPTAGRSTSRSPERSCRRTPGTRPGRPPPGWPRCRATPGGAHGLGRVRERLLSGRWSARARSVCWTMPARLFPDALAARAPSASRTTEALRAPPLACSRSTETTIERRGHGVLQDDLGGGAGPRASWPRRAPTATTACSPSGAAWSGTSPASAPPPTSAASHLVQAPTTLVAQVDSAYGGKTGVDLPEAKNYVGAYHMPIAVLADPATLSDASARGARRRIRRGRQDRADRRRPALGARQGDRDAGSRRADGDVIFECARTKIAVVADGRAGLRPAGGPQPRPHRRPRDRGRDRLLALPPRRGGRPRPAGRPAALGRRRPPQPRSRGCSPRTACPSPSTLGDLRRRVRRGDRTRQEADREGLGFVLLERARRAALGRVGGAG